MAKHRKKRKTGRTHHRRRRMGAVHPAIKQTLEMVGGGILGGGVAAFANQAIKTSFPTMPTWLGGGVGVALGVGTVLLAPPSPFTTGAAIGLAAVGGVFAINETVLSLPGISGMPQGVPNAQPGYLKSAVNGSPAKRMGNFSTNGHAVNGLYTN